MSVRIASIHSILENRSRAEGVILSYMRNVSEKEPSKKTGRHIGEEMQLKCPSSWTELWYQPLHERMPISWVVIMLRTSM